LRVRGGWTNSKAVAAVVAAKKSTHQPSMRAVGGMHVIFLERARFNFVFQRIETTLPKVTIRWESARLSSFVVAANVEYRWLYHVRVCQNDVAVIQPRQQRGGLAFFAA